MRARAGHAAALQRAGWLLAACVPHAAAQCTALSRCTDQAPFGMGDCKTFVAGGMYCKDASAYGNNCESCTCKSGCEADRGDGTPQNWRPGKENPLGQGASSNGRSALSAAQKQALVDRHNHVRAYHGACPLQWSDDIEQAVIDTQLSGWTSMCQLSHTSNAARSNKAGFSSLGENLASASGPYYANNFPVDLKTMAWYLEEYDYDYGNPGSAKPGGGQIGHFTQVVWKETTHVGCQMYQCDYTYGKKVLLACQYGGAGNMMGAYGQNVGGRGETATGCSAAPPPSGGSPPATAAPVAAPPPSGGGGGGQPPPSNPNCPALSGCTDQAPFGMGDCKTFIAGGFYCKESRAYGKDCDSCTCKSGCEGDGGDGTPQDWRPGLENPYGSGTSGNGRSALSAAQKKALVDRHNHVRAYHGACPLQWSDDIEQAVIDTQLSGWTSGCQLSHTSNAARRNKAGFSSLGENLASASGPYYANNFPVEAKTMAWYLEEYDYDYGNPGSAKPGGGQIGHFTQVVWKETTHVGCQMYQCDYTYGKKVLLACQYGKAGNMMGDYGDNVGARGTTATGCSGTPPASPPSASPVAATPPAGGGGAQFSATCADGETTPITQNGVSISWTLGEGNGQPAVQFRLTRTGALSTDYWAVGIGTGMNDMDALVVYPEGGSCTQCVYDMYSTSRGSPKMDAGQDVTLVSATKEEVVFWRPAAATEANQDKELSGPTPLTFAKGAGKPGTLLMVQHIARGTIDASEACFTCGGCAQQNPPPPPPPLVPKLTIAPLKITLPPLPITLPPLPVTLPPAISKVTIAPLGKVTLPPVSVTLPPAVPTVTLPPIPFTLPPLPFTIAPLPAITIAPLKLTIPPIPAPGSTLSPIKVTLPPIPVVTLTPLKVTIPPVAGTVTLPPVRLSMAPLPGQVTLPPVRLSMAPLPKVTLPPLGISMAPLPVVTLPPVRLSMVPLPGLTLPPVRISMAPLPAGLTVPPAMRVTIPPLPGTVTLPPIPSGGVTLPPISVTLPPAPGATGGGVTGISGTPKVTVSPVASGVTGGGVTGISGTPKVTVAPAVSGASGGGVTGISGTPKITVAPAVAAGGGVTGVTGGSAVTLPPAAASGGVTGGKGPAPSPFTFTPAKDLSGRGQQPLSPAAVRAAAEDDGNGDDDDSKTLFIIIGIGAAAMLGGIIAFIVARRSRGPPVGDFFDDDDEAAPAAQSTAEMRPATGGPDRVAPPPNYDLASV